MFAFAGSIEWGILSMSPLGDDIISGLGQLAKFEPGVAGLNWLKIQR
jgi:hypothetical protein